METIARLMSVVESAHCLFPATITPLFQQTLINNLLLPIPMIDCSINLLFFDD